MDLSQRKKILIESLLKEFTINKFDKNNIPSIQGDIKVYKEYFPSSVKTSKEGNKVINSFLDKSGIGAHINYSIFKKEDGSLFKIDLKQYYEVKTKLTVNVIYLTENYQSEDEKKLSPIITLGTGNNLSSDFKNLEKKFKLIKKVS